MWSMLSSNSLTIQNTETSYSLLWFNYRARIYVTHYASGGVAHYVYDDVIKWKHFPRNWLFVRGIHRSPVNSQHKGQWRGALMNGWVNNRGDLRRHRAHYDVTVMDYINNGTYNFPQIRLLLCKWLLTLWYVIHYCILCTPIYLVENHMFCRKLKYSMA